MTKKLKGWVYSIDGETYYGPFATRQEAVDEATSVRREGYFYIGREVDPPQPETLWNADDWVEHVLCQDEFSMECAEPYGYDLERADKSELEEAVREVMAYWLDKHDMRPSFFLVENVEKLTIEDADESEG